jgi:hypothetical protein
MPRTTKSGGRQPAVVTKRTRNGDWLSRMDHVSFRRFGSPLHGWLTPAAPGCAKCSAAIRHLRCTYAIKSGGRQPAVGRQNRIRIHARYSSADRRRCVCGFRCIRVYRRHGGLTPPALAVERASLPAKKRFLRCTSRTPDQERRASARRGPAKSHPHTRPLFVGRPPTVCVRIAVAFAFIGATGG